ncbi:MAG: hypothetical protein ACRELD_14675 [Longimicrobiales bacterium]
MSRVRRPIAAPSSAGITTVELRRLDVDGRRFAVVLHCHLEAEHWHGRLLFTTADRVWSETSDEFHGGSVADVLIQALSLPEPALTRRVRRVISG